MKPVSEIKRLRREIGEMVAKRHSASTVVSVLLARADDSALRAMAEQWLKDEVGSQARTEVRELERQVFAVPDPKPARRPVAKPMKTRTEVRHERQQRRAAVERFVQEKVPRIVVGVKLLAALEPLLDQPLGTGDGSGKTWGEATKQDFHRRRELLANQRNGIDHTIGSIDQALGILIETGVRCLNELRVSEAVA